MPSTESIPIFQQPGAPSNIMDEYVRYRCRDNQMGAVHPEMPDVCKKHIFSISAVMQQQAMGKASNSQLRSHKPGLKGQESIFQIAFNFYR